MTSIEALRARPALTGDRIVAAWADAPPVARRAAVAACAMSAALGASAPGATPVRWAAVATGVLLALAALVDLRERKLPNRLLAGALLASVLGAAGALDARAAVGAVAGLAVAGGLLLGIRLTRGVGMGDVKMAAVVGASCGSFAVIAAPVAIAIAALLAATYGAIAHRRRVALGPALWSGWAVALALAGAGWLA